MELIDGAAGAGDHLGGDVEAAHVGDADFHALAGGAGGGSVVQIDQQAVGPADELALLLQQRIADKPFDGDRESIRESCML